MINHIKITDFAIIENTEIDFQKGLNIITGETGAGKSVVIEAISLALGSRADSTFIRTGCEKARIQMIAELDNKEVIVTREISANGKNLCKIDGEIVTLSQLSALSARLADIHGQYDNQSLLNVDNHLKLVDTFEKTAISPTKLKVEDLYRDYLSISKNLNEMEKKIDGIERKKEFISHEINDIKSVNLVPGEDTILEEELELLKNREKIHEALEKANLLAYSGDDTAIDKISSVIQTMRTIANISKEASSIEDEFSDTYYRFEDVCRKLQDFKAKCVYSQDELDRINDRLYVINNLKMKYNSTIDGILIQCESLEKELYSLKNMETNVESLSLEKSRIREMLDDETQRLSALRRSSALSLEGKIQYELDKLNFHHASISINFERIPHYTSNGIDKVEFLISANKGEDLKPLAKIASGGEMSRIMLAFKKILGEYDGIPTMIFDEIDSGISGETAAIVGKALSTLSDNHQVISITHLPQIAACGNHNFRIIKSSDGENTYTTIEKLSEEGKIAEIARLLSGISVSDITIESAKEMILGSK